MISKSDQIGICGFCRKSTIEVKVFVRSDNGAYICCECIDTCKDSIEEYERSKTDMPENVYNWSTIKGWYKGIFFMSSYEYHFMKWLEERGINVTSDLSTLDVDITYQYEGSEHKYIPNFYVKKLATVFEVKSSYALNNDPKVVLKAKAANDILSKMSIDYKIITENDIPIPHNNSRSLIANDHCVFLSSPTSPNDQWELMFTEQVRFMKLLQKERNFPEFPVDLKTKTGQRLIKDISHDCMHELFEAIHLLANSKNHRKTDVPTFDRDAFLEEMSDVLHYFVEICIISGISEKEIYEAFMKKGTINFSRIIANY